MTRVTQGTIRKRRVLPAQGEVLVSKGARVEPSTLIARGRVRNPDVREIRLDLKLGVDAWDLKPYVLKKAGEEVKRDEVIALRRGFLGRTRVCRTPIDGTVESFSDVSGQLLIRGAPIPIQVQAFIPGTVTEVIPGEGAVVEGEAAAVEGVFGVGGETSGEVAVAVSEPGEILTDDDVKETHSGKVIVGGSHATLAALEKARRVGARAVITGAVDEKDLTTLLGYELGFGVTGGEALGLTVVLTEGFGAAPMDEEVFRLLRSFQGRLACVNGATQIRARMQRPEIILPK